MTWVHMDLNCESQHTDTNILKIRQKHRKWKCDVCNMRSKYFSTTIKFYLYQSQGQSKERGPALCGTSRSQQNLSEKLESLLVVKRQPYIFRNDIATYKSLSRVGKKIRGLFVKKA